MHYLWVQSTHEVWNLLEALRIQMSMFDCYPKFQVRGCALSDPEDRTLTAIFTGEEMQTCGSQLGISRD